jgi:ProP effector
VTSIRERFPAAFAPVRPLKIGIHHDIIERLGLSKTEVKQALSKHCNTRQYIRAGCVAGAARVDLDGKDAGVVTAEEAAARKLAARQEKAAAAWAAVWVARAARRAANEKKQPGRRPAKSEPSRQEPQRPAINPNAGKPRLGLNLGVRA